MLSLQCLLSHTHCTLLPSSPWFPRCREEVNPPCVTLSLDECLQSTTCRWTSNRTAEWCAGAELVCNESTDEASCATATWPKELNTPVRQGARGRGHVGAQVRMLGSGAVGSSWRPGRGECKVFLFEG